MKHIIVLLLLLFALLSCSRDWNSPLENDSDLLHQPHITGVQLDNASRMVLTLDYAYSGTADIQIERRISATSAFDPIQCLKLTPSTFADTTLNLENNYDLTYRVKVSKGDYSTDYSNQMTYQYVSTLVNPPSAFTVSTIELQGVRLNWQDNSGKETGYKIEKNINGAGYTEIASLPANAETYMDNITGMPASPQSLIYRIKAYTTNLNSAWQEQNVIYSGLGAPTNLIITDHTFYHFSIAWTRNSTIATGYQIERKKDGGAYTILATVGATEQTYTTELVENGTYTFRVRAVKNSDYSTSTNEVTQQINIVMPTEGLIAYYPFNGNANDESGNGHNGTVNGATLASDRFDNAGKAYDFDGTNDYIDTFVVPSMPNFTITTWIRPLVLSPMGIFTNHKYQNTWPSYSLDLLTYPIISCRMGVDNQGNQVIVDSQEGLTKNKWYYITLNYNGASLSIFINGILVNSTAANAVPYNNPLVAVIGANSLPVENNMAYFHGSIDELRIYNRALTEAEIQALYHEGGWTGR